MQQHGLAGFQRAALEHVVPDGEEGFRDRAGFHHRELRDHRQRDRLVRDAVFGIAAARDQRHHLVADLPALHAVAERDDFAGNLEPGNIARAGRRRIVALALHHVRPVHAGGRDLDQHFVWAG